MPRLPAIDRAFQWLLTDGRMLPDLPERFTEG